VIRFAAAGKVGVATIDRTERRNALDAQHCDDLRAALEAHRDLLAVVVTGAGSAFCAGADLGVRFADGGGRGADTFRPAFERLLDAIVEFPAPVIAAIHGPAIGAGMQLAVACDIRVAGPDARLAIPGGRLGILLSPTNIARLATLVGQGAARDFLLAGRSVDAREAAVVGLVQRLADDPVAAAGDLAREIASLAPLTVRGHKRALNLVAAAAALGPAARAEIDALEAGAFASHDLEEGMAAFAEKRPPRFEGR
jgi:enoyl-CoA hydratase/carnithine racemase